MVFSSLLKDPAQYNCVGASMFESRKAADESQQEFWINNHRWPQVTASAFYRKLVRHSTPLASLPMSGLPADLATPMLQAVADRGLIPRCISKCL
jgi:hypothetical protein